MNVNSNGFKKSCMKYLDFICENTSCHGGHWALKAKSSILKIFFQMLHITLQFFMLGLVIRLFFFRPIDPYMSTDYIESNGTFPKVTICSHRMFDLKKSKGLYPFLWIEDSPVKHYD